jgi:hypothetical protein
MKETKVSNQDISSARFVISINNALVNDRSVQDADIQEACYPEHYPHLFYVITVILPHVSSKGLILFLEKVKVMSPSVHGRVMSDYRFLEKGLLLTKISVAKYFISSGYNLLYRLSSSIGNDYYPFISVISNKDYKFKAPTLLFLLKSLDTLPSDSSSVGMLFLSAKNNPVVGKYLSEQHGDILKNEYARRDKKEFYSEVFNDWSTFNVVTVMMKSKLPKADLVRYKALADYTINHMMPYFEAEGFVYAWADGIRDFFGKVERGDDSALNLSGMKLSIEYFLSSINPSTRVLLLKEIKKLSDLEMSCRAFIEIILASSSEDVDIELLLHHPLLPFIYMVKFNKSPYELMELAGLESGVVAKLMDMQLNT